MFFFKKKKTADEMIAETVKAANEVVPEESKNDDSVSTGNAKFDIELTKIKARLEGFGELRRANSERFQRISEQIGELRGMVMDTNKSVGAIEVKATKASDLVASVQPEKLMIDVRKVEGKVEALHANIESNDTIMRNIMEELKEMRNQMKFYKGIEQVIKLNEEIKKELMEVKKVEASAKRHADKIDTIFIEVNKKFTEFDKFNDVVKDLDRSMKAIQSDFDRMKVGIENKEEKKEFVNLLHKFNDFERHTTNIIDLLDKKSKTLKKELDERFEKLKDKLESRFDAELREAKLKKEELPSREAAQEPPKEETSADDQPHQSAGQAQPPQDSTADANQPAQNQP